MCVCVCVGGGGLGGLLPHLSTHPVDNNAPIKLRPASYTIHESVKVGRGHILILYIYRP